MRISIEVGNWYKYVKIIEVGQWHEYILIIIVNKFGLGQQICEICSHKKWEKQRKEFYFLLNLLIKSSIEKVSKSK